MTDDEKAQECVEAFKPLADQAQRLREMFARCQPSEDEREEPERWDGQS